LKSADVDEIGEGEAAMGILPRTGLDSRSAGITMAAMKNSTLLLFYRGSGTDHAGRLIAEIHGFDFRDLEGKPAASWLP